MEVCGMTAIRGNDAKEGERERETELPSMSRLLLNKLCQSRWVCPFTFCLEFHLSGMVVEADHLQYSSATLQWFFLYRFSSC